MKKKLMIFCLVLLIGSLTVSAQSATAADGPQGAEAKKMKCPRKASVLLETVKTAVFSEYRHLSGQARLEVVPVASPVAGVVSEIRVSEGSMVDAGQELAVLNAGFDDKLKSLEQEAAKKKKILTARQNWKEKSEKAIQAAERDYQAALALLEEGQALANQVVKAPLAGMVRVKTAAGAEVALEALLFEILDPLRLRADAPLDADAAGAFTVGEKLPASAEGFSGTLEAEIVAVSEDQVGFRVDNSARQLHDGQEIGCKKLKADHADAIVIPAAAVLHDSLGDFIYVAEKKKAKKLYVTLGASEEGAIRIEKGLVAGTQLIVSGFECLADKKKIRVVNEEQMAREKAEAKAMLEKKEATAVKPAAEEEKKAVQPVVVSGMDEFIAYLDANKDALGYVRYEKSEWKGLPAVSIYSGRETQKKLLDIIPQFAVSEVTFELQDDMIVSTVAFKKAEAVIDETKRKAEEEKLGRSLFKNRLKIGLHGAYFLMLNKNFKDTYGGLIGFGGELSYRFSKKMDFWFSGGMASKKATPEWSTDEMQFKLTPLSGAVRYYLSEKGKMGTFVGAGVNVFLVEDLNPVLDVKTTLIGFHALGGFYYNLSAKLSLQLAAKFNIAQKDMVPESDLDDPLDLMGLQLLFGLSYSI
jgi:membrane fusion protein (multidrug efflux system)